MVAVAYGGAAVLAALDRQRRTGQGAFIDLAQYETGLQFVAPALLDYAKNGVSSRRDGNRDAVAVPHGCYPCRDGRWIALSCWDDDEWTRLAAALDDARLAADDGLSSAQGRRAREADLNAALARWTRAHDAADAAARLQRSRVHAAIVATGHELDQPDHPLHRRKETPVDKKIRLFVTGCVGTTPTSELAPPRSGQTAAGTV